MKALHRVLRGGSWDYDHGHMPAFRRCSAPGDRFDDFLCFRLVVRVKGEGMVDVPKS